MMMKLCKCPICNETPKIGYVFGEYFVCCEDMTCPCGGNDYKFFSSSEDIVVEKWNVHVNFILNLSFIILMNGIRMIKTILNEECSNELQDINS